MKNNIKLIIAYDGSSYNGFQRLTTNKNTIQEKLEICISRLLEEEIKISGSSRTDKGVHAKAQVVNFHTDQLIDITEFIKNMNHYLPKDIIVVDASIVPSRFHSRFWSYKKTYLYRINTHNIPNVFERNFVYNLCQTLDVQKMQEAAKLLIGEHDFQGFTKRKVKKSTVRTIFDLRIEENNDELDLYITADGFLYNMVRIIVGTLIEIGNGSREIESINEIFNSQTRAEAGYLAPSHGLILFENELKEKN